MNLLLKAILLSFIASPVFGAENGKDKKGADSAHEQKIAAEERAAYDQTVEARYDKDVIAFLVALKEAKPGTETVERVTKLIDSGFDVNRSIIKYEDLIFYRDSREKIKKPDVTSTPLIEAAGCQNLAVVELLVSRKANVNATTWWWGLGKGVETAFRAALSQAVGRESEGAKIAAFLLKSGAQRPTDSHWCWVMICKEKWSPTFKEALAKYAPLTESERSVEKEWAGFPLFV